MDLISLGGLSNLKSPLNLSSASSAALMLSFLRSVLFCTSLVSLISCTLKQTWRMDAVAPCQDWNRKDFLHLCRNTKPVQSYFQHSPIASCHFSRYGRLEWLFRAFSPSRLATDCELEAWIKASSPGLAVTTTDSRRLQLPARLDTLVHLVHLPSRASQQRSHPSLETGLFDCWKKREKSCYLLKAALSWCPAVVSPPRRGQEGSVCAVAL